MLKDFVERIKNNSIYIIIGLFTFWKGYIFFTERTFFFYPPQWTWLMNNAYFDCCMMLAGLALVIYSVIPYRNDVLLGCILGTIVFIFAVIVGIEWEHVRFAGQIKLKENITSNLLTIGTVFWVAHHWDKR